MASIDWDENSPSDTESLSLGDDRLRSLKTSLRHGLSTEHTWPSAGGDAGIHLLGSARAYVGPQSAVSSSGTDGRLMWASDTSQLFHVGSAGTSLIGGRGVVSMGTYPGTVPQRSQWVEEIGIASLDSTGVASVTIPNSGYSGRPYVFLSTYTTGNVGGTIAIGYAYSLTATSFGIYNTQGSAGSSTAIFWRSLGTRAL